MHCAKRKIHDGPSIGILRHTIVIPIRTQIFSLARPSVPFSIYFTRRSIKFVLEAQFYKLLYIQSFLYYLQTHNQQR